MKYGTVGANLKLILSIYQNYILGVNTEIENI